MPLSKSSALLKGTAMPAPPATRPCLREQRSPRDFPRHISNRSRRPGSGGRVIKFCALEGQSVDVRTAGCECFAVRQQSQAENVAGYFQTAGRAPLARDRIVELGLSDYGNPMAPSLTQHLPFGSKVAA